VTFGIVASLNRPGGNITGMTLSGIETVAKRLGLMLELVPAAAVIAILANPKNPISEAQLTELRAAARKLDRQLVELDASTESDIAAVSTNIDQHNVDALFVGADPFFDDRRKQIVSLAARHRIPACYTRRDFVVDGGLLSYGPPTLQTRFAKPVFIRAVFSKARSLPIFRSWSRSNSKW
jgi:putative ABC transport system substrate-binding protein